MELKKINDVFPNWITSGIFKNMSTLSATYLPPFFSKVASGPLDMIYHGSRSGGKYISPMLVRLLDNDGTLPAAKLTSLCTAIAALYQEKWAKEWEAYDNVEYDPLKNYDMTEVMTNDQTVTAYGKTNTRTNNLSHAKTGTETDTKNLQDQRTNNLAHGKTGTETETTTPNLTTTEAKNVYGFNSTDPTPSESISTTATGSSTVLTTYNTSETDTGTQTDAHTGTDATTYNVTDADTGTQTDAATGSDTETRNYELTRQGNIGVTTSQQMLQSERDLWLWNYFNEVVFPDVDKVLTLSVY